MKCGYGLEKITPPPEAELSGYGFYLGRKAASILDDLYAYSLIFEDKGQKYLLVNCDLLGFTAPLLEKTKNLIGSRLMMPAENILVLSTHIHTGPATSNVVDCGERCGIYMEMLPCFIASSAEKAAADLRDVTSIKTGSREIAPIGYNRVNEGGAESHTVKTVLIERENGLPLAIANYGCHPVSLSRASQVSADFPGRFVRAMADKGILAVFVNGPCGEINPLIQKAGKSTEPTSNEYAERVAAINEYGQRLASVFGTAAMEEAKAYPVQIAGFILPVKLRVLSHDELEAIAAHAEANSYRWPGICKSTRRYAEHMKQMSLKDEESAFIQVFFLGNIMIVGIPYETFTELGQIIANAFPGKHVLVAGNANETLGYLPTARKIEIGGYEVIGSTYIYNRLPIAKGAGEKLANDIVRKINTILS